MSVTFVSNILIVQTEKSPRSNKRYIIKGEGNGRIGACFAVRREKLSVWVTVSGLRVNSYNFFMALPLGISGLSDKPILFVSSRTCRSKWS